MTTEPGRLPTPLCCVGLLLVVSSSAAAANVPLGFLAPKTPGAESKAAAALAGKLHSATVIRATQDGRFVDAGGAAVSLTPFRVVWYHQGDSNAQTAPMYDAKTIAALRKHVSGGGGLYLSGAALGMVHTLGLEKINPRRGGPGKDASPAGLVPTDPKHPVFAGLKFDGRVVQISNTGFPAFADFHGSGGPGGGMLLARSSGGSENPLVEYELGKGRAIAMGWRLPHYAYLANPHRANLERLTDNILRYLADAKKWRKVVIRPVGRASRPRRAPKPAEPGVGQGDWAALKRAIDDLTETFGERYPKGREYLSRLAVLEKSREKLTDKAELEKIGKQFADLRREALLANPLLDFDKLMLIKRGARNLGLSTNWQSNSSLQPTGYDNEIAMLSPVRPGGKLTTLYRPDGGRFVGDVDLHFDAEKMLFSMQGKNRRWQVHELKIGESTPRELPLIQQKDVDNYDACYLPSENVIFTSTAPFVGVPCVGGSAHVSNLYLYDAAGGKIRQLAFDQDHNWCPTVLNNGRVMYLRWEYSDIPHFVSRILFHMNPDGTGQMEYYGSNSYWPNAMFYARPVPGHPTKFVAIIGGHHDVPRMGELILFDPARGRHEADGVIQRIPGYGKKVEPVILDGLVGRSWPKFLHPWPLSEKYFIVSCKPTGRSLWGVYLVDVFDNLVPICELPGYAMLEPIPLRKTNRPPVIPNKVIPDRKDAVMYIADIYTGPGLAGVPRGTVKRLRLVGYHFAYHGMGGQTNRVGLDGPWDVKRIIGTVPVESDGSAMFRVPANTPISIQPLDADGKALQLMRSWATAMPGEVLSCVGCHESQNTPVSNRRTIASVKDAAEITPWYGPPRGFSFQREVQPVLDKYCVGCHNGQPKAAQTAMPDFRDLPPVHAKCKSGGYAKGTKFPPSYIALRSYVRAPTIESDMHMLYPMEFHADTAKIVRHLNRGHQNVKLDAEAWDRLITWIDLHAPAHGTWQEVVGQGRVTSQHGRRAAMRKLYANCDVDPEAAAPAKKRPPIKPIIPPQLPAKPPVKITCPGWPFDAAEAKRRQGAAEESQRSIDLGEGLKLELVRIPAGEFVMGCADDVSRKRVKIERAFWIGKYEMTNEQFARFDPSHDSRIEHGDFLQFSVRERGYPVNTPKQPVMRISWNRATAFCRWLSAKTGQHVALPTEAQWEYACRAGTAAPMWYGPIATDFSKHANLADATLRHIDTFGWGLPSGAVPPWRPAITTVNDRHRVTAPVGSYQPNAWGLHDTHGNAAEWTRSSWQPQPTKDDPRKVIRGGSWYDRPKNARCGVRRSYRAYQGVFDVGFRVVIE